jgi:hypothetical protein
MLHSHKPAVCTDHESRQTHRKCERSVQTLSLRLLHVAILGLVQVLELLQAATLVAVLLVEDLSLEWVGPLRVVLYPHKNSVVLKGSHSLVELEGTRHSWMGEAVGKSWGPIHLPSPGD